MRKDLPSDELQKRKKANLKIMKFGCLPIIMLGIFAITLSLLTEDNKPDNSDLSTESYVISQSFAKFYIKYPEEAEFDFYPISATKTNDSTYSIVGNVITKNGFGVKVKQTYFCDLIYLGNGASNQKNWKLLKDVKFN